MHFFQFVDGKVFGIFTMILAELKNTIFGVKLPIYSKKAGFVFLHLVSIYK